MNYIYGLIKHVYDNANEIKGIQNQPRDYDSWIKWWIGGSE